MQEQLSNEVWRRKKGEVPEIVDIVMSYMRTS